MIDSYRFFLDQNGWSHCDIDALARDASLRQYFRLKKGGELALLMVAPKDTGEKPEAFIALAKYLRKLGIATPEIYAKNLSEDLLIIEDFGVNSFAHLLKQSPDSEPELYLLAVEVIIALHTHPNALDITLDAFTPRLLAKESLLFLDWLAALLNPEVKNERDEFFKLWLEIFENLPRSKEVLVLRDFHVDNLLLREDEGLKRCGVIDFQDALKGHRAYDLMSLLEDARRQVSSTCQQLCLAYYFEKTGMTKNQIDDFNKAFTCLAAQRHIRVLGLFVRLWKRDGRKHYLRHLTHIAQMLCHHLESPALKTIADFLDQKGIFPTPERVKKIQNNMI